MKHECTLGVWVTMADEGTPWVTTLSCGMLINTECQKTAVSPSTAQGPACSLCPFCGICLLAVCTTVWDTLSHPTPKKSTAQNAVTLQIVHHTIVKSALPVSTIKEQSCNVSMLLYKQRASADSCRLPSYTSSIK